MNKHEVIVYAANACEQILEIKKKHYNSRKKEKKNFNFFTGIVSGKNTRHHLEMYHSNFIAYLLDPNGSHDFGRLFLEIFIKQLGAQIFDLDALKMEREMLTDKGRFIDIALKKEKEWLIFIENKVWSHEQPSQMHDYCKFASENFENWIGIYLTLNGELPSSIQACDANQYNPYNISYEFIIKWLSSCCSHAEVKKYPHVISALNQYIFVIKKLLNKMNEENTAILEKLKLNKKETGLLIENQLSLNYFLLEITTEIRGRFKQDLELEIQNHKLLHDLSIEITQGILLNNGGNCYGLGFKILKNNNPFNYGGEGHGGAGNGLTIIFKKESPGSIDAHNQIDKANCLLFKYYDSLEWGNIVKNTAEGILAEVNDKVIPKLQ